MLRVRTKVGGACLTMALAAVFSAAPAFAGDSPSGYFYGTDSQYPQANGSSFPYQEPTVGGVYGGYLAEVGTWTDWTGCTSGRAISNQNVGYANANSQYQFGTNYPTGTGLYWYMAGPGADPSYNTGSPSSSEAYSWGWRQGEAAYSTYQSYGPNPADFVMFMDIENPGTGMYSGWDEETNSCGALTGTASIPTSIDRQTFDGFWDYIYNHTPFIPGVYARQDYWNLTFGTGPDGQIPNTYQWAAQSHSSSASPGPSGWCQSGSGCAAWFGGVSSRHAFAWQWAIIPNNEGDYDQFYAPNKP